MMNVMLLGLVWVVTAGAQPASADLFKLPPGFAPILDCAAADRSPDLMIARKNGNYVLAAKNAGKVQLFELEVSDADMGYVTFNPVNSKELGALESLVESIHVFNDEEDIEDPELAVIVGGDIATNDGRYLQECVAIGTPRI